MLGEKKAKSDEYKNFSSGNQTPPPFWYSVTSRFVRYAEPKKKRYPCSRVIDELARDIRYGGYPQPEKVGRKYVHRKDRLLRDSHLTL